MRKLYRSLLALLCAGALVDTAGILWADELHEVVESYEQSLSALRGKPRPRTSAASDPDTVYIGHVVGNTGLPGVAGGAGPYHIGRGGYLLGTTGVASNNGYWDWDRFNAGETDSLQGWWPLNRGIGTTGGVTVNDKVRPFHGFDYGNTGNFSMNAGSTQQRTFGVIGYWHRDPGNGVPGLADTGAVVAGPDVEWAPLAGSNSAWCGLRGHGDNTVVDAITGNPFNQTIVDRMGTMFPATLGGSTSSLGTDKNYPGYGNQWDQLLYRDVALADGASLSLSFKYRTAMDNNAYTLPANRIGWFDKDPLKTPAANDANFISSTDAGVAAPIDSFMVYVGAPVNDAACVYSDGSVAPVYDPLRRWFSEVIRVNDATAYYEVLSRSGTIASTTASISLTNGQIQPILDAQAGAGGNVRVVFRVKTNRGYSDEDRVQSGYSSGTAGAAIVDDVVVNGWAAAQGDFEAANAIDNTQTAINAWRSTGRPPGVYFHAAPLVSLIYLDPCGAVGNANRQCNMVGRIISPGDADDNEKPGGAFGTSFQDRHSWFGSPTINLKSPADGVYNDQGIDADIADATGDYKILYEIYTGGVKGNVNGNFFQFAAQVFPTRQANGLNVWGEIRTPAVISSFAGTNCLTTISRGFKGDNIVLNTNPSGIPDSLRIYIQHLNRCFGIPALTAATCSPNTGFNAGIYFDNLSLAFIDSPPPPGISINIWDLIYDTFPVNDAFTNVGGVAFDTCAAHVRIARNISQGTGNLNRHNIPGDSVVISAGGNNKRLDMVFRILPGVGNYVTVGNRASGVAKRPDGVHALATAGDGSFWGEYLADNGAFGTGGNGTTGPGHGAGGWDPNRWNSARCDSAELNFFPAIGNNANLPDFRSGVWASTYHESDPKYGTLGIVKNRCFLINQLAGAPNNASNTTCGAGTYPPAWATAAAGLDPNEVPGLPGRTREFTKIIPDGQLTPGAHTEYFFRKSTIGDPIATFEMGPDTNHIFQPIESSTDGHRWQEFSVLPDRWKDAAFGTGGQGMACLLFVDANDRRGDELFFISVMDSIGGTAANKRGAHNGWSAPGTYDWTPDNGNPNIGSDPTVAVYPHIGQAGTIFDMFGVKAIESGNTAGTLASRNASQVNPGLAAGKFATYGPSGDMLRRFYRTLYYTLGDQGENAAMTIGPYADKSDDDRALLNDFANNPAPAGTTPRAVWLTGRGWAESFNAPGYGGTGGAMATFRNTYFGALFRSNFYRVLAGTALNEVDLIPQSNINTTGAIYGVNNFCTIQNDVFDVNGAIPGAAVGSYYENAGTAGPYVSGVYVPNSATHPHITYAEGFRIQSVGSRYTLSRGGLFGHYFNTMVNLFGSLNCALTTSNPVGIGDTPGGRFVEFMNLKSSNPMRSGEARIAFGIAKTEKVEVKIYDVSGRLVKTVANRTFAGGQEHVVSWDGTNDAGNAVARGVYFYQLRSPSFTSQKKLAVLKN